MKFGYFIFLDQIKTLLASGKNVYVYYSRESSSDWIASISSNGEIAHDEAAILKGQYLSSLKIKGLILANITEKVSTILSIIHNFRASYL